MSNKQEIAKLAREIKSIKAQLNKQSGYDWSDIKNQSKKVDWYEYSEDGDGLQLGYYGPWGSEIPDIFADIYQGSRENPFGFYVEVSFRDHVAEQYPMLAKKLTQVRGFDSDGFTVDTEDFLVKILGGLSKIMDAEFNKPSNW